MKRNEDSRQTAIQRRERPGGPYDRYADHDDRPARPPYSEADLDGAIDTACWIGWALVGAVLLFWLAGYLIDNP